MPFGIEPASRLEFRFKFLDDTRKRNRDKTQCMCRLRAKEKERKENTYVSAVIVVIAEGKVPDNPADHSDSSFIFVRAAMPEGIVPLKELLLKEIDLTKNHKETSMGCTRGAQFPSISMGMVTQNAQRAGPAGVVGARRRERREALAALDNNPHGLYTACRTCAQFQQVALNSVARTIAAAAT